MSTILNSVKEVIAKSIKVEVKSPIVRNGRTKFPVLVTDISQSFTSGWYIQYNPEAFENNTVLKDNAEVFTELTIARFSQLHNMLLTANYYFLQGHNVIVLGNGKKTAKYELEGLRLSVSENQNSIGVYATITDESSPFYMLSIPFTVTPSKINQGEYYVIGTDDNRWDKNTDCFKDSNAYFAPRKARYYKIHQEKGGPASFNKKVKIAVSNNQYEIKQDGTFNIDLNTSDRTDYIQVISSEYKALAYIYEQAIMQVAFPLAVQQGLPVANVGVQTPNSGVAPTPTAGFVPAFSLPGMGAPNPNATPAPAFNNSVPAPPVNPVGQPQFQDPTLVGVAPILENGKMILPWTQ